MVIAAINGVTNKQALTSVQTVPISYAHRYSQSLKQDSFVKSPQISFKGQYQRPFAENYIEKIEQSSVKPLANGWQCEFYKVDDEIGIKAPKPLHPEIRPADFNGHGNVKEYFALNKINQIDPDIAVKPHDLINRNDKNYLVMDFVKGEHPYKSKLTNAHLEDIMNKTFKLDIKGVLNNDLQGGNIILTSKDKTKFIDFGSFSVLTNKGDYLNSDVVPHFEYQNGVVENMINSSKEGKFLATYYSNTQPNPLMRSDNPFLKIESNKEVFEYRTLYDYLKLNREENPKEFFSQYLKTKSQTYHEKMVNFLESLNVSQNDTAQFTMRKNAIEQEKVFKEVFSNPSENVMKSELGRIQLKWLVNNTEENRNKVFSTFNEYLDMIKGFGESAQGNEKKYYEAVNLRMNHFKELIGEQTFQGGKLKDDENILKIVFEKVKEKAETIKTEIKETVSQTPTGSNVGGSPKSSGGKKVVAALAITGLLSAGAVCAYKKYHEKASVQSQPR